MSLLPAEVEYIFDYIEELCGIALDNNKSYLIDARLGRLVKQFNTGSATELIKRAKLTGGDPIRKALVEAMTTRETLFFRDGSPFEALQFKALPELLDGKLKARTNRLRIWSAAASTGQEACSIGIILNEMIPDIHAWDVEILLTDISEDALAKARKGIYTSLEVERGLPANYANKYFRKKDSEYKINDNVARLMRFQQLNLLQPFNFPHPFDIVFCRNVAIYFERKVKIDLFQRIKRTMAMDSYLFVGASETLLDCGPEFKPLQHCRSIFYRPNDPARKTETTTNSFANQLSSSSIVRK